MCQRTSNQLLDNKIKTNSKVLVQAIVQSTSNPIRSATVVLMAAVTSSTTKVVTAMAADTVNNQATDSNNQVMDKTLVADINSHTTDHLPDNSTKHNNSSLGNRVSQCLDNVSNPA
jgi:Na+-translocating ferredoxin:NAD+ oxidoreductase RnfG subunit